jgi:hypothetical protein
MSGGRSPARATARRQPKRHHDYPDERDESAAYTDVPASADLIGDVVHTGKGLGPAMIRAVVDAI